LAVARSRCARSAALLADCVGRLDAAAMMAVLRDHGEAGAHAGWHPRQVRGGTICMHAGAGRRTGQSVAALVCDLRDNAAVHWVTGTSAPCTSIFKPVFFDSGLPDLGPQPGDRDDRATLWWRHEALHRARLGADGPWPGFAAERDALERTFIARAGAALAATTAERRRVTLACWREAAAAEARWLAAVPAAPARRGPYLRSWAKHDGLARRPA
jgi:hypothetical protein